MRLFISYARVDKHFCREVVDLLDMHEVWYDQRLQVGQRWWDEIMHHLQWCDGFIYLLSPESIQSRYCQKEVEIARRLKKQIFPVTIQPDIEIPNDLREFQYADLSHGLDVNSVKSLLSALYTAERYIITQTTETVAVTADEAFDEFDKVSDESYKDNGKNHTEAFVGIINEIGNAMDDSNYDMAVFLIKQLMKNNIRSRINLEELLEEAENELEKQAYMREAARNYRAIKALLQHKSTQSVGITAFKEFRKNYVDYDPENLGKEYQQQLDVADAQFIEDWCKIPTGKVIISDKNSIQHIEVSEFEISKYPVTNRQFQYFADAPNGYQNGRWWKFSRKAFQWHSLHPQPLPAQNGDMYPRSNICWYEVVAYCNWLSSKVAYDIKIPTAIEWQRAARGDSQRTYPWGDTFDIKYCNTKESECNDTTPVNAYSDGVSSFGVWDMSGNTWEWTRTNVPNKSEDERELVVKGGSFMGPAERAEIDFQFGFRPEYRYNSIGFRLTRHSPTA